MLAIRSSKRKNGAKKEIISKGAATKNGAARSMFKNFLEEKIGYHIAAGLYHLLIKMVKLDTVDIIIALEKTVMQKPPADTVKKIAEVVPKQKGAIKEAVKKDTATAMINKECNIKQKPWPRSRALLIVYGKILP